MTSATTIARQRTAIVRLAAKASIQNPIQEMLAPPTVKLTPGPMLGFTGIDTMPEQYAVELAGGCMEPDFANGTLVLFSKSESVQRGDFVCIWFRPEGLKPGEFPGMFKRLSRNIPHFVKFPWVDHPQSEIRPMLVAECFNPPRKFAIPCANVLAVHKCIGVVKQ